MCTSCLHSLFIWQIALALQGTFWLLCWSFPPSYCLHLHSQTHKSTVWFSAQSKRNGTKIGLVGGGDEVMEWGDGMSLVWSDWNLYGSVGKNTSYFFNPLNAELNPICYLLTLLGAHHFLHVSRISVKSLSLRLLMSYIYGEPTLDVSRSHTTTQHSR